MFKPGDLHTFLNGLGISPKKSLSQNFLVDGNIIRKTVEAANLTPGETVLEIGPGPGALTLPILAAGAYVVAVEKDPILAGALEQLQTPDRRLSVFAKISSPFLSINSPPGTKVIANLPYHLTTPILTTLVPHRKTFSRLVLIVQEEVARRFTASPGNKQYGSITLFLQYHANVRYTFTISRNCFYPRPKVDSAVITLDLKVPPPVSDEGRFFQMTRTAFNQRRKMMRTSLKELFAPATVEKALEAIGKDPQSRPEQLSLEDFLALFETLSTPTH